METVCTTVKPTGNHERVVIPLSGLDTLGGAVHISNHRFFHKPLNNEVSFEEIVHNLQSSLAEALGLYPPVAGTIRFNDLRQWVIDCDSNGASFVSEQCNYTYEDENPALTSPRPEPVLDTPGPVLAVKVLQFSCGTIAVATSMHHLVTDLAGFVNFLETWSALSRGEAVDPRQIPTQWSHTPERYFLPPTTAHPSPPPGYKVLDGPSSVQLEFSEAHGSIWSISMDRLKQLKGALSSTLVPTAPQSWISSGDALSALVWGALTRAREAAGVPRDGYGMGRSSTASGIETLAMAVDGREPSIDRKMVEEHYLGNVNLLVQVAANREDILTPGDSPEALAAAGRAAAAIRSGLTEQLSPQRLADRIQFFTQADYMTPPGCIEWNADTVSTNWTGFDLESDAMAIKYLGPPFETTPGGGPFIGGFFRLMARRRTREVHILLCIEKTAQGALRRDILLNKYVTFVKDAA